MSWISRQVASTFKTISKVDNTLGTNILNDLIVNAAINYKQEKMYMQLTISIEEVVSIKEGDK